MKMGRISRTQIVFVFLCVSILLSIVIQRNSSNKIRRYFLNYTGTNSRIDLKEDHFSSFSKINYA